MPEPTDSERQDLLASLMSEASHERLTAARRFALVANSGDIAMLRQAYEREGVSFVRRSLAQTLTRLEEGVLPRSIDGPDDTGRVSVDRNAYWKAVDWITGALLHEILPRVGAIEYEAARAIPDYDNSALSRKVAALTALMDGVEELRAATISSSVTEINLEERLKRCSGFLVIPPNVRLIFDGRGALQCIADPNLLSIAFCNGLKNAIEASAETKEVPVVIVSWGETEIDYWVTIADEGSGLTGTAEAAFEIGRSTKRGHRGFGLAIARQAMMTIDGSVSLKSNQPSGAIFELRWFK